MARPVLGEEWASRAAERRPSPKNMPTTCCSYTESAWRRCKRRSNKQGGKRGQNPRFPVNSHSNGVRVSCLFWLSSRAFSLRLSCLLFSLLSSRPSSQVFSSPVSWALVFSTPASWAPAFWLQVSASEGQEEASSSAAHS